MYGICLLHNTIVKANPYHVSEIVNQLLFGEIYKINQTEGSWTYVTSMYDHYKGWIQNLQITPLSDSEFEGLNTKVVSIAASFNQLIHYNGMQFAIPMGSTLPNFDPIKQQGTIAEQTYQYKGKVVAAKPSGNLGKQIVLYAKKYLNAPYLWGGRSPFGIDCSGFTQVCAKLCGLPLLRDAYQQAEQGFTVPHLSAAQVGDLAFFSSDSQIERITHVGIICGKQKIIHAAGKVHIATLKEQGIWNEQDQSISHFIRTIKRVF